MKKNQEGREAELKVELQRLRERRKALKDDMKKLKRELKELKGFTLNRPLDDDDDDDHEGN